MKVAAIDIGTNSTRLLIANIISKTNVAILCKESIITRLGEGLNENRVLSGGAIERTLSALSSYNEIIKDEKAERVRVVATSAMREAENSQIFITEAKQKFDMDVEIISGEEEAKFSFSGATYEWDYINDRFSLLVIDVGGGSTELIVGKPLKPSRIFSFNIGCVRLTEELIHNDPPTPNELRSLKKLIRSATQRAIPKILSEKPRKAIALAGTATTLAAIKQHMEIYDYKKIHNTVLNLIETEAIFEQFINLPLERRKMIVGLEPGRADVVIAGTLIILEILKLLAFNEFVVSENDILNGLALSLF
ncbi:MAG: Ppx/GppA family phosphatase [Actinobacteria bacterium]|nr:Ppx/GppA family phosphatase [Actinomycetota bacterium]